eukprot:NODE_2424_length_1424_cov_42.929285_g2306_i0.p1 GENE.NODE_2424_length_1424_cov_42.929285_g2306_i0~~NODE_2424_length_1424_cov_42.929285_g2306_i0.p1  ORF type:complete len:460 (-),score=105.62 NODE_2424_length_1424_cov_42.929285_g2306_i0:44-1357(-)
MLWSCRRLLSSNLSKFGEQHVVRGIGRSTNLVLERGQGSWLWDVEGRKFMDLTTGIGVANLGHCHPRVVKAAQEQMGKLCHAQVNISFHQPMLQLIEKLKTKLPKELDSFFFWNSGAEAVEAAVKLARHATKRPNVVVMQGSYHGRTLGTMAMTTSKTIYSAGFGPLMPGVHVCPFPYYTAMLEPATADPQELSAKCLKQFEAMLHTNVDPQDIALVIMEPVLGEGGYVAAPEHFVKGMQEICKRHGILFAMDEVQSGFCRTGHFFNYERIPDFVPDILIMAKGIANGLPLSAIVSRKELTDRQAPGSMGGTYAGNAVACAAACAVLDSIEEERVLENVAKRGEQLVKGLASMKDRNNFPIEQVRGYGLMVGVQFSESCAAGTAKRIVEAAFDEGMLMLTCGSAEILRLIPALTITEEEMAEVLTRLEKALLTVFSK